MNGTQFIQKVPYQSASRDENPVEKAKEKISYTDGIFFPASICPYLFHSLIPYLVALDHGGYFRWRRDKNSVEVLCPNPSGQVNVLVERQKDGKPIKIKVISVGGICEAGHKSGDELKYAVQGNLVAYASSFPEIVKSLDRDEKSETHEFPNASDRETADARKDEGEMRMVLRSLEKPCLFHRRSGETFRIDTELTPEGMCPRAFYQMYPHYFGLLYDAWKNESKTGMNISCSGNHCQATWNIRVKFHFFSGFLKIVETILRALGRHLDVPDRKILMKMTSSGERCRMKHNPGREFSSDLFEKALGKKIFCPQSFYTLYPYLSQDGRLQTPWDRGKRIHQVSCPAVLQKATYSM